MKTIHLIKTCFQVLAFLVFVYQMHQSASKYLEGPIVLVKSTGKLQDIQPPVVFVCQQDQFNYSSSMAHGYENFKEFMAGKLMESNTITWKGKTGNISFEDLLLKMLPIDYSNFTSNYHYMDLVLFPHGYCKKLKIPKPDMNIIITTTERIDILFTDPNRANNVRGEEEENNRISLENTSTGYHAKIYEASYIINDARIEDGFTCTDYTAMKSSYGTCISDTLEENILATYGCLAPWFPSAPSNKTCKEAIHLNNIDKNLFAALRKDFQEMVRNRELKMFKKCLPPCVTMNINLKHAVTRKNLPKNALLDLISKDDVTVYTEVYGYDIFNLVVDLGSALGLWLGLSALSILDFTVVSLNSVQFKGGRLQINQ